MRDDLLVRVLGVDGVIESGPVEGTRPRGASVAEGSAPVAGPRIEVMDRVEDLAAAPVLPAGRELAYSGGEV